MLKPTPSDNITHRLFNRQISTQPPGSQLHSVRKLYENIVPSHTVYDVDCPDHVFRKFTSDGQFLIAFTRSYQQLVVYRFNWMSHSFRGEEDEVHHDHPRPTRFESFFTQLYCVSLASGNETICKDFFLTTENGAFGLFATCTRLDVLASTPDGAVPGVPSLERIKLLVVRLADGVITDDRVYRDDFIHLSHNMGVFMYEDLLAVLSIRNQCVHILQIRGTTGTFIDVRKVGDFCQEDDELLIKSHTQREMLFQSKQAVLRSKGKEVSEATVSTFESSLPEPTRQMHGESASLHETPDVDFESYFRSLLGESTSSDQRQSAAALRMSSSSSRISNAAGFPPETGHLPERRNEYVITSRQQPEESLAVLSLAALQQAAAGGLQTPVSSTGSRSIAEPHSSSTGAAEVTTTSLHSTTVTTSSRNEVQAASLPSRGIPLATRFGRFSESSSRVLEHEQQQQQQSSAPDPVPEVRTLCGIKQRLLSFIFRSASEQDGDLLLRAQRLKRFYYHFQHYLELVMWKVQFLDRYHLLIKFGSADGVLSRDASQQPGFFVVYNVETTEILEFQPNSSEEFLQLFENFSDHFRASPRYPAFMNYVTSYANNVFIREQIREQKAACFSTKGSKSNSYMQIARRTLASLPVNSQSYSPSVYFDHSLFHFDEKLISATDKQKPSMEHPIKFISRRKPHSLKFKINPGPENGANDSRVKRVAAFIFHPVFPFAISVQQSFMQASVINFHFRR